MKSVLASINEELNMDLQQQSAPNPEPEVQKTESSQSPLIQRQKFMIDVKIGQEKKTIVAFSDESAEDICNKFVKNEGVKPKLVAKLQGLIETKLKEKIDEMQFE